MRAKKAILVISFLILFTAAGSAKLTPYKAHNAAHLVFLDKQTEITDTDGNPEITAETTPQKDGIAADTAIVIFTFDDGYVSDYELAYPILKAYGIRGTSYIIPQYQDTNRPYALTWDEIREMKQYGWDFGSHTYAHTDVTEMTDEELKASMENVDAAFIRQGFNPPEIFAFPYGRYSEEAITVIKLYCMQMRKAFYNTKFVDIHTTNPYGVDSCSAEMRRTPRLIEHEQLVDKAVNEKAILVFRCHCLYRENVDDMGDWPVQTSSKLFAELVEYCVSKGCRFMTMSELAQLMSQT